MSLTGQDLKNIEIVVERSVTGAISGLATKAEVGTALDSLKSDLDRMEGRLITAINLLQRDTYSRLDDHDARIARLEQANSR